MDGNLGQEMGEDGRLETAADCGSLGRDSEWFNKPRSSILFVAFQCIIINLFIYVFLEIFNILLQSEVDIVRLHNSYNQACLEASGLHGVEHCHVEE